MKNYNVASIDSIESAGMLDGPGIRTIIFFSGCMLRCKYCHNPETWIMNDKTYSSDDLLEVVLKNKAYFRNGGGVTLSGGEPLLQTNFLVEFVKKLKEENIHVALDTAGVSVGDIDNLLPLIDLVIMDVKHVDKDEYKNLTGYNIDASLEFFKKLKINNNKLWIRQVIIPDYNDNIEYLKSLKQFLNTVPNIEKVEFLPYHTYGKDKYKALNIPYEMEDVLDMDFDKCDELLKKYNEL